MLKLAGELLEGQLAEHIAHLDAHTRNIQEILRTGEYYRHAAASYLNVVLTQNLLYAAPFHVPRDFTVDRIAIRCQTLEAGKSARLGIYNNGSNLYPGTLLLDAGTVSLASTGVKAINISQALTKGLYWVVLISDATGSAKISFAPAKDAFLGVTATRLYDINAGWEIADTYGALPDPFPGGGSIREINFCNVALRILSLD